jgi:hypothetical protein
VRVLDTFDWTNLTEVIYVFQSRRFSVEKLKWSFAGSEHVDSHIAIASISRTGEDLSSLNTMSWG